MITVNDIIKKTKDFVIKHDELLIFGIAFTIEIIFGLILINKYGNNFFNIDTFGHLYVARVAVDNGVYTGLGALVGTWLPIFQILLIPFVMIDKLYMTGFSGTIVNAFMTGGICVFLYKLLGGRNNRLSILGPILFVGNVYSLIFGAIPMTEQTAIFFLTASSYFLKNYLINGELKEYIKCSFTLILGSLTRYELWIVVLFVIVIFLLNEIIKNRNVYRTGYSYLPALGIPIWIFVDFLIHKDLFWFAKNPSSSSTQATMFPQYFYGSIYLTIKQTFIHMNMTFGILLYLAIISIIFIVITKKTKEIILVIILFIPSITNIILMVNGQSYGWQRAFYVSISGIIFLTVYLVGNFLSTINDIYKRKPETDKKNFYTILTYLFIGTSVITPIYGQINLGDPWIYQSLDISEERVISEIKSEGNIYRSDIDFDFFSVREREVFGKIKENIGNEKILIPTLTVASHKLSVSQGISPEQIIDDFDYLDIEKIMTEPWRYTKFVLIVPGDDRFLSVYNNIYNGNFYLYNYYKNEKWRSEFLNHYDLIYESDDIKLFSLKYNITSDIKKRVI